MARLWSSGVESQSVTAGVEYDVINGSPTVSTSIKRTGQASLRTNPTAATQYIQHQFLVDASGVDRNVYARVYVYIASAPGALIQIIQLFDGFFGAASCSIRMNSNRTLELWDGSPAQIGSDSSALNLDTWYRLEIEVDWVTSSSITVTGYIDGVSFASGTFSTSADDPGDIRIGCVSSATADLYFDDIAVNDNSGSTQTGLPGAGAIVHMKPDSAGDNAATTGLFSAIDEVTPNDATDYIELDNNGDIGDYNLESSSSAGIGSGDTITLVQVGIREVAETAASEQWVLRVKSQSGGTLLESAAITHNDITWRTNGDSNFFGYQLTSYVDPQAGGAWTPALLDTAQIGIRATDATPDIWVSTLWLLVEGTAITGGGGGGGGSPEPAKSFLNTNIFFWGN